MALRTIVVLLDGSPGDQDLLRQAQLLAARPGRLVLVEAVQRGAYSEARNCVRASGALEYLAKLASQPTLAGHVDFSVLHGDAARAVVEEAFVRKADMLVVGLPGRHGLGGGTAGAVVEHVLARSPLPVFLVRTGSDSPRQMRQLRDHPGVLVALDGSAFAEAVLPVAAEVATRFGGVVTLLQVVPLAGSLPPPGAAALDIRALDSLQTEAWAYLREVAGRFAHKHGVDVPWLEVRIGQPASAIADTIRDRSIRLAVMATHARPHWWRLFLGSVTDQVLQHTSVPLVLVRPQALAVAAADVIISNGHAARASVARR
jgi:nucleotide-binding universal stress UspA family protein